jgi:hypothetical protein
VPGRPRLFRELCSRYDVVTTPGAYPGWRCVSHAQSWPTPGGPGD